MNMEKIEVKDQLYLQFLTVKRETNPVFTDEDFLEYLLVSYETCCGSRKDSLIPDNKKNSVKQVMDSTVAQRFQCPECTEPSGVRQYYDSLPEITRHFQECHEILDTNLSCTCNQIFSSMSEFLTHYIQCPVAATDLQQRLCMGDSEDDSSHEKKFKMNPNVNFYDELNNSTDENDINNSSLLRDTVITKENRNSIHFGKVYSCDQCDKFFKSKGLLEQHKHIHYPPKHECEHCGRRFRWPPQFYTHKQQCTKRKEALANKPNDSTADFITRSTIADGKSDYMEPCLCGYTPESESDKVHHKTICLAPAAQALLRKQLMDCNKSQSDSNSSGNNAADYNDTPTLQTSIFGIPSILGTLMTSPSSVTKSSTPSVAKADISSQVSTDSQNFIHNSIQSIVQSMVVPSSKNPSVEPPVISQTPVKSEQKTGPVLFTDKPHECDFCDSKFATKISLKQHIDGKHSQGAKYRCAKCGKGYHWNASFNYHRKKCNFGSNENMDSTLPTQVTISNSSKRSSLFLTNQNSSFFNESFEKKVTGKA